ncbi:UNVERIFIED_CONTAM: hypothetical protein Sradi_5760000 [Sesamum radiatum]|uniref:Uncharacterized protein n=1 Tax=Sesamum radiatum TaxID=300843 RepID=A0AAW2L2W9_SESRA
MSDELHFLLVSLNADPYDCRSLIDKRLLGHFDFSPWIEPLGDSLVNIMFGKLLRNQSGNRGGGTPPCSPMKTPSSSDSKGKRPASASPSMILGGFSKKSRPSPLSTPPSGSARSSLGLPSPPPVKDERGVPLRVSRASSDGLHSFSSLEVERGRNLSLVSNIMRGSYLLAISNCCSFISRGVGGGRFLLPA